MKKISLFFALAIVALSFTSCEKDDEAPSKTSMLTSKPWKMTAYRVDPAIDFFGTGVEISNLYAQFNCFQDNTVKFQNGGTYASDEGTNRCDDIQTETGTWTFNPTETVITLSSSGISISAEIVELTSSKLKIRYSEDFDTGLVYTFEEEYVIQ